MANTNLEKLTGEPLSAVAFVQDYVEFHFDGKILRSLTAPLLQLGKESFQFPMPGSRDGFCSLIGQKLTSFTADQHEMSTDGSRITLNFESGAVLTIPLDRKSRRGPEAAHFCLSENDQAMEVW